MQIGSLASSALYNVKQNAIKVNGYEKDTDLGILMLAKQLSESNSEGVNLIRAMEQSVNPNVGGNVDYYA